MLEANTSHPGLMGMTKLAIPRKRDALEYMRMRAHLILAHFSQTGLLTCQVRWSKVGQKTDLSDHMVLCPD
jgi:hypothetical protein